MPAQEVSTNVKKSTHALGSGLRRRCRRPNPMEYRSNDTLPSNSPPQRSRSCLVTRLWNPNRRYRASERRSGMGSPKDCADQYLFQQSFASGRLGRLRCRPMRKLPEPRNMRRRPAPGDLRRSRSGCELQPFHCKPLLHQTLSMPRMFISWESSK